MASSGSFCTQEVGGRRASGMLCVGSMRPPSSLQMCRRLAAANMVHGGHESRVGAVRQSKGEGGGKQSIRTSRQPAAVTGHPPAPPRTWLIGGRWRQPGRWGSSPCGHTLQQGAAGARRGGTYRRCALGGWAGRPNRVLHKVVLTFLAQRQSPKQAPHSLCWSSAPSKSSSQRRGAIRTASFSSGSLHSAWSASWNSSGQS